MNENIITFIDHIGRTMLGVQVKTDKNFLYVKDPAIIHVQPTQQGQLNVQTIPLYFREFLGEKSRKDGTTWKFNLDTVVLGVDIDNDPRLLEQYKKLFVAQPTASAGSVKSDKVIKLFDE
ncbi:hypothetical protein EBR43_10855 [bacterium]|nr:hypothetical protein [bacterium]